MAEYRWYVGDLLTGKISREVDLVGGRWSTSFEYGVAGTMEGSFPLRSVDPATGLALWPTARADTAPGKAFLAVSYLSDGGDETFLEAGPIWTTKYDDTDGVLQVGAGGLSSYFDKRKAAFSDLPPSEDTPLDEQTELAEYHLTLNDSLAGIARDLVELSQAEPAGNLPIVLPDTADIDYGINVRNFFGYELEWLGAALKKLTEVLEGPEIQFVPRRRTDDPRFIEWVMQIGRAENGLMLAQDGPPWQFDRTVPESDVRDIDIDTDGSGLAERVFAAGEGEAEGRPIVWADAPELLEAGWPLLEAEVTATDSVSELGTLAEHAYGRLASSARPRESWSIVVSRDGRPNVGQYRAGDWARLRIRHHDYVPDGDYDMRILAISGSSGSEDVQLTLSERLAVV